MKAIVNLLAPEHEHEFEAAPGLPEALPASETLLWQGSPAAWSLARQALHLDWLALYFAALLVWRGASAWHDGQGLFSALGSVAGLLPLFALALALLGAVAWLMARTSVYTLTNRRLVMRVGVVLSITFNLPFAQIVSADLRRRGARQGDIVLGLGSEARIAYPHLWPHARPWRLARTQPMLRALPDAEPVAALLAQALRQAQAERASAPLPLPQRAVPLREPASAAPLAARGAHTGHALGHAH